MKRLSVHANTPKPVCVIKIFNTRCNNSEAVESILQQTGFEVEKIRRLHFKDTNKKLQIAVIHCKTSEDLSDFPELVKNSAGLH